MEVLKGRATGVRYTVHVTGNKDGVSTRHHALFKLGATTVMFSSGAPPVIGEGDKLVVAGRMRGRVLLAEAFRNDTASIRADSGLWTNFVGMLCGIPLGAAALGWWLFEPFVPWLPRLDEPVSWMVGGVGAVFTYLGFYCLYKWLRIRRAIRLVREG